MHQFVEDIQRLFVDCGGPVRIGRLELKAFEEGADGERASRLREAILVSDMNVFDSDLEVLNDLGD